MLGSHLKLKMVTKFFKKHHEKRFKVVAVPSLHCYEDKKRTGVTSMLQLGNFQRLSNQLHPSKHFPEQSYVTLTF